MRHALGVAVSLLCLAGGAPAYGAEAAGRDLFADRCGRCHGQIAGSARAPGGFLPVVMLPPGPNLTGVYGRRAGQVAGYRYSDAFRAAAPGLVWDGPTLDRWLTDSRAMIPGTYMLVKIEAAERAAIIGYLEAGASR